MEADLERAAEIIKRGGVGVFPTETVYGLGAHPFHADSLERIYRIKGRGKASPLSLHISSLGELFKFSQDVPEEAGKLIYNFWPGPLALILPASPLVPSHALSSRHTVSFRYPDCALFLQLARLVGVPIAATSANQSGSLSPICALDAQAEVGEEIDFLIDGGLTKFKLESTIVDLTTAPFSILREGAISQEELEEKTGFIFQHTGNRICRISLILIEGSEDFFAKTLAETQFKEKEIVLSSFPLPVPFLPLEENTTEEELFRLLNDLMKEGYRKIYLRKIWPEEERVYARLKIRAEKIIQERRETEQ
jgi:tRNA threonylcarbamoyl adenosine modification protein (Sua5/YciO/YrdC/YwlC family)